MAQIRSAYQYVLINNQNSHFPYLITAKWYSSRRACERDTGAEATESCFSVIRRLPESRVVGEYAERLTRHERSGS